MRIKIDYKINPSTTHLKISPFRAVFYWNSELYLKHMNKNLNILKKLNPSLGKNSDTWVIKGIFIFFVLFFVLITILFGPDKWHNRADDPMGLIVLVVAIGAFLYVVIAKLIPFIRSK